MEMRIMVVDDEPEVLKAIKSLIEPFGIEVLAIADSREAVQRANTDKFDGVVVDCKMPYVDGFGLTEVVRSSPANSKVPIVMLTGFDDVETMRRGFKAGITFFLSKPIDLKRMSSLLRAMRGPMLKEKRRYARLPFRTSVSCQLGAKQFKTESVNISEGGMLLEASGGASVGQELGLEFTIPQVAQPLKGRGKVIRKEAPDQVALQFVVLDPQGRQAIQDYITGRIKG
jgi:CheY-like chemotaxis protein